MWDSSLVRLVRYTLDKYERDNCGMLSAGLAYFAIFSLFPLILVVLSLVGFFIDPNTYAVQEQLLNLIGSDDIRDLVTETLQHFNENRVSVGLLGFVTLFFAATGIFGALSRAFRVIWEVKPAEGASIRAAVLNAVLSKVVAFEMVVGAAALILISALSGVLISMVASYTDWLPWPSVVLRFGQPVITLVLLSIGMAALFKFLPGRPVPLLDVWPAAIVAAVLFTALQAFAGLIFGLINFSSFGVLGGAMALLTWIYFCCQVILVGGELSFAWANLFGSLRK